VNRQLEKYLRTRAVNGPWRIVGTKRQNFRAAVVIPALAERDSLPQTLASVAENPAAFLRDTLVLVVVNNRVTATPEQKEENCQLLDWLANDSLTGLNLAWIDGASNGYELPEKEGVGLARKIGFDLALDHLDWNAVPFLVSLDADTLVDKNYLPALFNYFANTSVGGAVLPFRHRQAASPTQDVAIRHYELYLRSYLFGLQQAGSPYAYHTIGSAFACRAGNYVAAGGMNRRHAAEDFYFLQQLAKVSGITLLRGTIVRPSPRFSARVPFGTGRAVQARVDTGQQLYAFVSATAFRVLEEWLALVAGNLNLSAAELVVAAEQLSPQLSQLLSELNFGQAWERMQENHHRKDRRLAAFHHWFDALRSRQLLTRIEGCGGREEALVAELLEWGGYSGVTATAEQLTLLERLQGVE